MRVRLAHLFSDHQTFWGVLQRLYIAFALTIMAIAISAYAYKKFRPDEFHPFGNYQLPQTIIGNTIISAKGGTISVHAVKCFRVKEATPWKGTSYFVRQDDGREILLYRVGVAVFDPEQADKQGCLHLTFNNTIPALHPGVWRIEGQDCINQDVHVQCRGWFTQKFVVK